MLDLMFWVIVITVVWFAISTREAIKNDIKREDERSMRMETINETRR